MLYEVITLFSGGPVCADQVRHDVIRAVLPVVIAETLPCASLHTLFLSFRTNVRNLSRISRYARNDIVDLKRAMPFTAKCFLRLPLANICNNISFLNFIAMDHACVSP